MPGMSRSSSATPSSLRLARHARPRCVSRYSLGAGLDFRCRVLVEAVDRGDLAGVDIGHLLDAGEAFRGQHLADHLVDVERFHEQRRALDELLLAALRLFLLGEDVDVPAGELRGEADVLAAPADRQRQLIVGHHHLDALGILVEHHLGDFRRLQRVDDEGGGVLRPRDDVDLLALQFADDRLHAGSRACRRRRRPGRSSCRARSPRSWRGSPDRGPPT